MFWRKVLLQLAVPLLGVTGGLMVQTVDAQTNWTLNTNGVWQVNTNWSPTNAYPNAIGASALLGSNATSSQIIQLGDNVKLGTLTISNNNNYSISGSYNPTFDIVGTNVATLNVYGSGSPYISANVTLLDNLTVNHMGTGVLTLDGSIPTTTRAITKTGTGILELNGINSFGGGLFINQGTVRVYSDAAMGNGTNVTLNGGTLNIAANLSPNYSTDATAKTFTIGANGGTIDVNSNMSFLLGNKNILMGSGVLTKTGAGTLILTNDNSAFTPSSINIAAGTIKISAENNLGAVTNDITLDGGKLNTTASMTVNTGKVFTVTTNGGTLDVDYNTTLTLGSNTNLTGSGNLTKDGRGTLVLGGTNIAFTGTNIINAGVVQISREVNLGSTNSDVILNGGTLNITGTFTNSNTKTLTIGTNGGTLDIDNGITNTFAVASQIIGSNTLTKTDGGVLSITGNQNTNWGGTLAINGGTVSFSSTNGSATGLSSVIVKDRATLLLDNSAVNNANRLAGNLELNGGKVRLVGHSSAATAETLGTLTLSGGSSTVEVNRTASSTALTLGSLSRTGKDATVNFSSTGTGTLGTAGNNPRIVFTSAPTMTNSILGGWATIQSTSGGRLEFVGLNGTNGVMVNTNLNTGAQTTWAATNNARAGANVLLTASRNIYSLTMSNGVNLNLSNFSLTIGSGGIISQTNNFITNTGANGFLTVGATNVGGQMYVHVATNSTLTNFASIKDNGSGVVDLVKANDGRLILAGTNTYTGGTYINGGILQLANGSAIADTSAVTVASGATFNLTNFSETVGSIQGGGDITLGSGTITSGGNNSNTTFSGTISGTGGNTKTGSGTLTLTGTNTYTGNTTISNGTVSISQEVNLGAAANDIVLSGGTLKVTESFTANTNKDLRLTGAGTVNVESNKTLTFTTTNQLTGTGNLTKDGAGTLTLGGQSNYTGNLVINGGQLKVEGSSTAVSNLLTSTRVGALTGTGGTLTWAVTNLNSTNTIAMMPSGSTNNIKIGFDASSTSTTYVLAPTNSSMNWAGMVINGGSVSFATNQTPGSETVFTLTGTSSTTLEMNGGELKLAGTDNAGGKTLAVSGDVTLNGGSIYGGPGGGSHGTLSTKGNIISAGTTLDNGPNITMIVEASGATNSISGTTPLNGVAQFTKQGAGTVRLDQAMTVTDGLSIQQGTLLLGANNRLNDNAKIDLVGGTFATGGYSETVGQLTLSASSTIDMGAGNTSYLAFADSSALESQWTGAGQLLTIVNYNDYYEKIYFGTTSSGLTTNQLAQVRWSNPYGNNVDYVGAIIDADGRIRPGPVPEPATIVSIILLAGLVGVHERRRIKSLFCKS